MPIKTVAAIYAGKEVFKHLVADVYKAVLTKTKMKYKQWDTVRKIDTLYKQIYKVRKVNTIWQVDKTVDLETFYCDSHIIISNRRQKIVNVSDFKVNDNLVITGIAGQGKSIFLRHLCAEELNAGKYIPIFIELRKIQKGTLLDRIYVEFKNLRLTVDDLLFDALANSGKILLLLDAFDEVPDDEKQRVLTEIEDLASTKEQLKIIITTRPNNHIDRSLQFSIVRLDNLSGNEYQAVIQKLTDNTELASALINRIEQHTAQIKDLLCTPLMVTLLIISFKAYQQLPTQLSGFYESLFQLLIQRHDGTKPGYTRDRGCKLDDIQYRYVFETLCTLAKESRESSFSHKDMYGFSKKALAQNNFSGNPEKYLNDIVKITCLILRDGDEYRFIHKSVQEYYTAAFIKNKPEPLVKSFYTRICNNRDPLLARKWANELEFLSEIDKYRHDKYFLLPKVLNLLKIKEKDLQGKCPSITLAKAKEILKPFALNLSPKDCELFTYTYSVTDNEFYILIQMFNIEHSLGAYLFSLNYKPIAKAIKSKLIKPSRIFDSTRTKKMRFEILQLVEDGVMKKEFMKAAKIVHETIFSGAVVIASSLRREEEDDILKGLM